jgi:hypothetical protein
MADSSTDYSSAWNNVKFDPGAYSSGADFAPGASSYGSSFSQYRMPSSWDGDIGNSGFSTNDAYGGGFNLDPRSNRSQNWGDTGWGKGVIGASKFLKNYFDQNPNLSNRYSGSDPYGRGNVSWGSPPNVSAGWEQLGATTKALGTDRANYVVDYPPSHQIGYIPGTPGSRGWGSTALGIAGGLASIAFPGAAAVIGPATGALTSGMSAFNI